MHLKSLYQSFVTKKVEKNIKVMNKINIFSILILSFFYFVNSDFTCADILSGFKTFSGYHFDPWHVKKAFIRFLPHPNKENLLYSPRNAIKCNYKIADSLMDDGIVFYAELVKPFDDFDGCDPIFVPFADLKHSASKKYSNPIVKSNHSVIFDLVHEKYIVIYTCMVNPENELVETGVFIFIDQNMSGWELKPQLNKVRNRTFSS